MKLIEKVKHKYALSDQGAHGMIRAILAVSLSNLVLMLPVGLLYKLASDILAGGISSEGMPFYFGGIAVIIVLIILTTFLQYNATFLSTYVESGVRRRTLAEKLRKIPLSYFGKKDLADLTNTIMGDCAWLETASSHFIPELIGSMISTTIVVIGLFFFNVKMTVAAVWVMPVAFLVIFAAKPISHKLNGRVMQYKVECMDGIQECLETMRDLKSYNATQNYFTGLEKKIHNVEKHTTVAEYVNAIFVSLARLTLKLGIGTVALTGGILFSRGEIDALTFLVYLLVVSRMYDPIQVALENFSAVIATDTQCKRMDEILSHEEQGGRPLLNNRGYDICFDQVAFAYENGEQVLSDVSFTARQGEVTALIGPSGGGKTTVSRLAARFWDAQKGTISVGGMNVSEIDPETLLGLYSIVFQDVTLFNNTILENIRIGKKDATDEQVYEAARLAHCDEFVEKLPDKWNSMIGENGAELSGGERQRISIARAFLKDAPIILMDEATASLDVDNESLIQESLSKLIQNKTVLIIAHRMRTVAKADKIVVLQDGRVAESGTPEELEQLGGIYSHMAKLQKQSENWKYV